MGTQWHIYLSLIHSYSYAIDKAVYAHIILDSNSYIFYLMKAR